MRLSRNAEDQADAHGDADRGPGMPQRTWSSSPRPRP